MIQAYWHFCDNFGDALTPYLIKKISGADAACVKKNSKPPPLMVTGSILGSGIHRGIVWGSGSAFEHDLDPECFASPSEEFQILATRGQLSKKLVEMSGHTPLACGDPGLLLPRFYLPSVEKKYKLGIMCSWVDYEQVVSQYDGYDGYDLTIINSMGEVENIIDQICQCEALVSSTLHGFIAAVAYQIPTLLVQFSDKMIGDGFKFRDLHTCLEFPFHMIDLRTDTMRMDQLIEHTSVQRLSIDVGSLYNCCPFKAPNDSDV